MARSIRGVKRPIIHFFVNCLSKVDPEFKFEEPFYDWVMKDTENLRKMHKEFQHETPHLELKDLLRKAYDHLNVDLDTDAFTWPGTTAAPGYVGSSAERPGAAHKSAKQRGSHKSKVT